MQRSVGDHVSYLSYSQKSSSSHFLVWHKPLLSNAVQLGWGILKRFPNLWIKIDCCLSYDSFWTIPKCSLHLITFQWVPCTLPDAIVQAFIVANSFAVGSSLYPCQKACVSKSVPRDVISLIGCSNPMPRSAVGVMPLSWGWLLSVPFLWSSCSLGFLRCMLMTPCQSGVSLKRHLKVLFMGLLKCNK